MACAIHSSCIRSKTALYAKNSRVDALLYLFYTSLSVSPIAEAVTLSPLSRLREEFHDLVKSARFAAAVKSLYLVESDFDAALEFLP